jgi:hypothetical protein
MAIFVYDIVTGALHSEIPDAVTIPDAQAANHLASDAQLAAAGFAAVDLPLPLGPTVKWNPATRTTITVAAPVPAAPMPTCYFLQRFTAAEYAAVSASSNTGIVQFWDIIRRTSIVDMSDPAIIAAGQSMITLGLLTAPRANTILTAPFVPTSQTR